MEVISLTSVMVVKRVFQGKLSFWFEVSKNDIKLNTNDDRLDALKRHKSNQRNKQACTED